MSEFNLQDEIEELMMAGHGKILAKPPTFGSSPHNSPNVFKKVLTSTMVKPEEERSNPITQMAEIADSFLWDDLRTTNIRQVSGVFLDLVMTREVSLLSQVNRQKTHQHLPFCGPVYHHHHQPLVIRAPPIPPMIHTQCPQMSSMPALMCVNPTQVVCGHQGSPVAGGAEAAEANPATAADADSTSTVEGPVQKRRKLARRPVKWIRGTGKALRRSAQDADINKMFDKTKLVDKVENGKMVFGKGEFKMRVKEKKKVAPLPCFVDDEVVEHSPGLCLRTLFEGHLVREDAGSLADAEEERTDLPLGVLMRPGDSEPYIFNEEDDE